MTMEIKISKVITYRNIKNIAINRYKIFYKERGFWIDMADFEGHPDHINVLEDKIILKEPVALFYVVVKKSSQKGTFLSLKPQTKMITSIAEEPLVSYDTSVLNKKELESSDLFNIEDIITLELFKPERTKPEVKNEGIAEPQIKTTSHQNEKVQFINKILDLAIHQKITDKSKDKIVELVGREVDQSGINKEILNRLEKVEALVGTGKAEIGRASCRERV